MAVPYLQRLKAEPVGKDPGIQIELMRHCLLCGSAGRALYEDLPDRLYGVPGTYGFSECPRCRFVWLNPRPCVEDLLRCYPAYRPHEPRKVSDGGSHIRRLAKLRDRIRSLVLQQIKGYPTDVRYQWDGVLGRALSLVPAIRHRATYGFDDLLPPYVIDGKLLDVGCGSGDYLNHMRLLGWHVMGVDFSPRASRVAKELYGIEVVVGSVEEARITDSSFDVVTMSHAIEHVHDPLAALHECHRILVLGGRLILTTPNLRSLGHTVFRRDWVALDPPRHLWLFAPSTLRRCVEECGFTIVKLFSRLNMAANNFDLSLQIRRDGKAEMKDGTPKGASIVGSWLARFEKLILTVSRWSGEELMLAAVKR